MAGSDVTAVVDSVFIAWSTPELESSLSPTTLDGEDDFVPLTLLLPLSVLLPKARMPTKLGDQRGEIEIVTGRCRIRPIMNVCIFIAVGVGRLSPEKETIRRR